MIDRWMRRTLVPTEVSRARWQWWEEEEMHHPSLYCVCQWSCCVYCWLVKSFSLVIYPNKSAYIDRSARCPLKATVLAVMMVIDIAGGHQNVSPQYAVSLHPDWASTVTHCVRPGRRAAAGTACLCCAAACWVSAGSCPSASELTPGPGYAPRASPPGWSVITHIPQRLTWINPLHKIFTEVTFFGTSGLCNTFRLKASLRTRPTHSNTDVWSQGSVFYFIILSKRLIFSSHSEK